MLIRERTEIRAPLLERLPKLRLISQRSVYPHIDIDACTRLGIIVSLEHARRHAVVRGRRADLGAGARGDAPDPAAGRVAARPGAGRSASAARCAARRSASTATAGSAQVVAGYGRAFGMNVLVWAREPSRAQRARADGHAVAREQGGVLRDVRRAVAAHAARRRHARHRHRRRPRADEADRAAGQHQPRRPDRAGRARRRAARGPARHGRGRRVRGRSRCATRAIRCSAWRTSSARRTSATSRARSTGLQFADIFDQINAYAAGTPINVVNPDVLR